MRLLYVPLPAFVLLGCSSPCALQGKRFQIVDATWRATMRRALEDPKALHAMRQPGLLARLTEANALLDLIQKGLNAYLETKRLFFPRFFFLSNDELLEVGVVCTPVAWACVLCWGVW